MAEYTDYPRRRIKFGGDVYVNSVTGTDSVLVEGVAQRFETSSKKLNDIVIKVVDYATLFGDVDDQTFEVDEGGWFGLTRIDISTLYFKNATAQENGTVHIIATEE